MLILALAVVILAVSIAYLGYAVYDRIGWFAYELNQLARATALCDHCVTNEHEMGLHDEMEEN